VHHLPPADAASFAVAVLTSRRQLQGPLDLRGLLTHEEELGGVDPARIADALLMMGGGSTKEAYGIDAGIRALDGLLPHGYKVLETGFTSCYSPDRCAGCAAQLHAGCTRNTVRVVT
jgi:hypothetical protein